MIERGVHVDDEHIPVLAGETLDALALEPDGYYVDATFGRGGHTALLLAALGPDGRVLALDRDPAALAAGRARFAHEARLTLQQAPFAELTGRVPAAAGGRPCRGILMDLGVSSPQLDDAGRGFSFRADGPLDMRMDPTQGEPVSALLARASFEELREVIATLGEERFASRVAHAIVAAREVEPLTRTATLAGLVSRAVRTREPGKHPATRTFQALRMWVNDELGQLAAALAGALEVLAPGGRLAVISFHSLEDRLVKRFIQGKSEVDPALARLPIVPQEQEPRMKRIAKIRAQPDEIKENPRARSALLRVAEKIR
jgi:16S rRNA (cytosine1402-N4)-methyltransferase